MSIQINNTNNNFAVPQSKKKKFTDNFQTKLRNSADMSDCISVPRTIFKGYLGIMFGTTLATVSGLVKNTKAKTALLLGAAGLSTYGTWSFARPYVLKGAVPTVQVQSKK